MSLRDEEQKFRKRENRRKERDILREHERKAKAIARRSEAGFQTLGFVDLHFLKRS